MAHSPVSAPHSSEHPKWRADIDGLRAIAVSSVVLFHAFPRQLEGGYVGVDIFFVISGFLISSIIFGSLNKSKFSFADFYGRRVRRIFPALILVLVSCYAFGWNALLSDEFGQFGKELAGGAGFVSNLVLWSGSGYFDNAAELKPLLHLWSLGIEEQFYMVWPLLLWFAWKRRMNFFAVTVAVALASFAFNAYLIREDMVATFYSPLTRFWELLAGAVLAHLTLQKKQAAIAAGTVSVPAEAGMLANLQSIAGALLLAAGVFLLNKESAFPGYWALLPVLGAVLIIAAGEKALINKYVLSNKLMVWVGLISYPLYLWHWPLLAFPRIVVADEPSWWVRAAAVVSAVVLAWLTYAVIEKRVRTSQNTRAVTIVLSSLMVVVAAAGIATFQADGVKSRPLAQLTVEISKAREDRDSREPGFYNGMLDLTDVRFAGQKSDAVLFLGDSLMAHYYSRVEKLYANPQHLPEYSTTFAARPGCRPVPGGKGINSAGKQCDDYYQAVIALAKSPEYKRIVFSASWQTVFSQGVYRKIGDAFTADLSGLKAMGKEIYFISMAPSSTLLDPTTIVREVRVGYLTGKPHALEGDRAFVRSEIEFRKQPQWQRMSEFAAKVGVVIIDPFETLCTVDQCPYVVNGSPLFRDDLHIRASVTRTAATYIDPLVGADTTRVAAKTATPPVL